MSEHAIEVFTKDTLNALLKAGKDFTAHSVFSPSGSSMWATCSGSLLPNLFADDTAGLDAATGTVAHSVGEQWLISGEKPVHLLGTEVTVQEGDVAFVITVDETMFSHVERYFDWCYFQPGTHFIETRVDFSDLTPLKKQTGTADHAACQIGKLVITDLKYGQGVQVFAKDNTQLILYAYGFFRKYDELFDFQEITMRICQPRLNHFDEWTITRAELLKWAAYLKKRAFAAWCLNAPRTPSQKGCTFCKIKANCAAYAVFSERLIDGVFDDLDTPVTEGDMDMLMHRLDDGSFSLQPVSIGTLTIEQKVILVKYRSMVEGFFKALQDDIESRVLNGEVVPGLKAVEGKSSRVFTDIEKATQHLEFLGIDFDVIRPRGMIGITEAEAQLIKAGYKRKQLPELLKPVVRKPPGKPSVVSVDDPRPAITDTIADTFDNLDEEL